MNHLENWFASIRRGARLALKTNNLVTGECNKHLGPRWISASVTLEFSPADCLEVTDTLDPMLAERAKDSGWYDYIIFGVLDVVLTTPMSPISDFRLVIRQIEFDEVDSTPVAFRLAARDAAMKALKEDLG